MRDRQAELDQHGIHTKIVSFDNDFMGAAYVRSTNLSWPLLRDSEMRLYRSYGMERGSWWSIYGPSSIIRYLKLILSGRRPGKPGKDWRQLGGDVLIDPQGIVRLHHVSDSPHDRPTVDQILKLVEQSAE